MINKARAKEHLINLGDTPEEAEISSDTFIKITESIKAVKEFLEFPDAEIKDLKARLYGDNRND